MPKLERREYMQKWQADNREHYQEYQRNWWSRWISDPENKKKHREYVQRTEPHTYARKRKYYSDLRLALLQRLGGNCARCGFADSRALQIDHINGGGTKDCNRRTPSSYYRRLQKLSDTDLQTFYQLLCANCNWIKRSERRETKPYKYMN